MDLDPLLNPKSIAIVGATARENSWPNRIWNNLKRFGYKGKVYPVNPRYGALWGLTCYPTLDELPETVDSAIIIVPAPSVIELLKGTRPPKFRSATIFSGGFGEGDDPEGLRRKELLAAYAREKGVRFCGPNCMGLISMGSRAVLFPDQRLSLLQPGGLALVSQSGGLAGSLIRAVLSRGLGLSYLVNSGNEADAGTADFLHYFLRDESTKLVAAIVEGVRDAEKFLSAAEEARACGKPIIVLKIGSSPKGAEATLAHTGALAGNDRVFDAFCLKGGIVRVSDLDELVHTAELFLRLKRLPAGRRAAFVTFSGGLRGFLSDLAYEAGLELPDLNPETEKALGELLGVGTSVGNPLDTGWSGLSSQDTYLRCVRLLLNDPNVDMLAVQEELPPDNVRPDKESNLLALARVAAESPKPIAVFSMATQGANEYGREFKKRCPLPFLEGAQNAVKALEHLGSYAAAVERLRRLPPPPAPAPLGTRERELLTGKKVLDEWESHELIGRYGVPFARAIVAADIKEAVRAAETIGFPVVVKLGASGVTHKTELGGVKMNLRNAGEVESACREIEASFRNYRPSDRAGFLVQESVPRGVETIIGSMNDPQFGPAVMFGLGGEFVEIYRDVSFRMAPLTREEALEMIRSIKGFRVLAGFRGKAPVDIDTLSKAIVSVSLLAAAGRDLIDCIDVNPFICLPEGGKAVDAVIVTRS